MSRCKSCNAVLTSGELAAKNKTTGDFEDLCRLCNHTGHDTGVIYEFNTSTPCKFVNEVFHIHMTDSKGGLGSPEEIINVVKTEGSIKTVSNN